MFDRNRYSQPSLLFYGIEFIDFIFFIKNRVLLTLVNAKYRFFRDSVFKKTSCVFADAFNKGLTSVLSGRLKTFLLAHSPGLYVHCTTVVQCLNGV